MSENNRECAKCRWTWTKRRGREDPATCPNPKCRTRLWKGETFRGKPGAKQ